MARPRKNTNKEEEEEVDNKKNPESETKDNSVKPSEAPSIPPKGNYSYKRIDH